MCPLLHSLIPGLVTWKSIVHCHHHSVLTNTHTFQLVSGWPATVVDRESFAIYSVSRIECKVCAGKKLFRRPASPLKYGQCSGHLHIHNEFAPSISGILENYELLHMDGLGNLYGECATCFVFLLLLLLPTLLAADSTFTPFHCNPLHACLLMSCGRSGLCGWLRH